MGGKMTTFYVPEKGSNRIIMYLTDGRISQTGKDLRPTYQIW